MKILITSDWHLDAHTMGVSRFPEIHKSICDMLAMARRESITHFFFLGDLSDIDNIPDSYKYLAYVADTVNQLEKFNIKSYWLNGNHDCTNGVSILDPLKSAYANDADHWFITSVQAFHATPLDSASFVFCPYPVKEDENTIKKQLREELEGCPKGKPVYVLSHMTIQGMPLGEESYEMAKGVNHILPLDVIDNYNRSSKNEVFIIQGHYHKRQVFRQKGPVTVQVVGAPARFTYKEADHDPGYIVLEV